MILSKRYCLLAALAVSACHAGPQRADAVLSPTDYGAIVFGEPLQDAEARLGEPAQTTAEFENASCGYVAFEAYPDVRFMVEGGRITRAESTQAIATSVGFGVGDSLTDIQTHAPSARIMLHKYDPNGRYVIFKPDGESSAVVLETADGWVTAVRGGVEPSVQYVEGCL